MIYRGTVGEYLEVRTVDATQVDLLHPPQEGLLSMLWFEEAEQRALIDGVAYDFEADDVIFLTEFHQVRWLDIKRLHLLRFNRAFYCIADHDAEIGCKGLLYFGASTLPLLHLNETSHRALSALWQVLETEIKARDGLQLEMLQMLLKRLLILSTRLYKQQTDTDSLPTVEMDLYRAFNFLVEQHFSVKHTVAEYADLLHKSPKTLSNWFKKAGHSSPLQLIRERRMLEARRLLAHTELPISDVGQAIGFLDVQGFSRFFKRYAAVSPTIFRQKQQVGKN